MRLLLSRDMTCTMHAGVTRVQMAQDGEDVVVLLVPTAVTSAVVTGQVRALTDAGYRVRSMSPLADEPHVTAWALARPLRVAGRAA